MYIEIIEFGDIPIFLSLFITLKLTICFMYVVTSIPKLGIPKKVELANACINSEILWKS
jgi:hypothetical protein